MDGTTSTVTQGDKLTSASLSKRANSSLSSFTSSWALQVEDSWVKPTMSANKILEQRRRGCNATVNALRQPHAMKEVGLEVPT